MEAGMGFHSHIRGPCSDSNKMRGQRLKREAESADEEPSAHSNSEIIDVSSFTPRCRPFREWRELIQKVWEADPLLCHSQ